LSRHDRVEDSVRQTSDVHIRGTIPLTPPDSLRDELPAAPSAIEGVAANREAIQRILEGRDPRMLVVVGPCSIHDEQAALEYARRLKALAGRVAQSMVVVMRVYFEKPRTILGWKGLINDPHLNGTFDIASGLRKARQILVQIADLGLPAGTEMLEPITPQYVADLVAWAAIGARTTESQTHRQMASGLSMPVGYKNATDGNLEIAIHAMQTARHPHSFLGIDPQGRTCIIQTTGNPWGHLILRGGRHGPNYSHADVKAASQALDAAGLCPLLMIDCSHANSEKDYTRQAAVWEAAVEQRLNGNRQIMGLMLESNLRAGSQKLGDPARLEYGVSITDGCIGWDQTEDLLTSAHERLHPCLA
jgi:3-deoxy-7-phosphoheptulonate synthase